MASPGWWLELPPLSWCKAVLLPEHKVHILINQLVLMLLKVADVSDHYVVIDDRSALWLGLVWCRSWCVGLSNPGSLSPDVVFDDSDVSPVGCGTDWLVYDWLLKVLLMPMLSPRCFRTSRCKCKKVICTLDGLVVTICC